MSNWIGDVTLVMYPFTFASCRLPERVMEDVLEVSGGPACVSDVVAGSALAGAAGLDVVGGAGAGFAGRAESPDAGELTAVPCEGSSRFVRATHPTRGPNSES